MNFDLSEEQASIVEAVQQVCTQFDMEYWDRLDKSGTYPHESTRRCAKAAGWAWRCPRPSAARAWASWKRRW